MNALITPRFRCHLWLSEAKRGQNDLYHMVFPNLAWYNSQCYVRVIPVPAGVALFRIRLVVWHNILENNFAQPYS